MLRSLLRLRSAPPERGRRFYEVQPDGSHRPHMVWRAFRGWFPDA
jgi:hypothetical protein